MSDAINQVNELERKALWSYLDRLSKRVEVLERENREQWDFMIALSNDMARIKDVEERLKAIEGKVKVLAQHCNVLFVE